MLNAHLDPATFISSNGVTLEGGEKGQSLLITKDPPEHEWHRKVVSRVFTPRRIGGLEPFVRADRGRAARPVPRRPSASTSSRTSRSSSRSRSSASCSASRPTCARRSTTSPTACSRATTPARSRADAARRWSISALLLLRRSSSSGGSNPGDDVVSLLITSEVIDDDGNEFFLSDERARLRASSRWPSPDTRPSPGSSPTASSRSPGIPTSARELVGRPRRCCPRRSRRCCAGTRRRTTRVGGRRSDVELHGVTIPADSRVLLVTGAANHDERQYERPRAASTSTGTSTARCASASACTSASAPRWPGSRPASRSTSSSTASPTTSIDESGIERMRASNVRGLANLPILVAR